MNNKMMNYRILILALIALCTVGCSSVTNKNEQINKGEVEQMLTNWKQAFVNKDFQLLESILDKNFLYSGSNDGKLTTKTQMVDNLKNDKSNILPPEYFDIVIKYFEDIAIVRAKETLRFIGEKGDTINIKLSFTDVYQKKNGKILTLSTHSSPITEVNK